MHRQDHCVTVVTMLIQPAAISLFFALATGFTPQARWNGRPAGNAQTGLISSVGVSTCCHRRKQAVRCQQGIKQSEQGSEELSSKLNIWGQLVWNRLNTLRSAGLEDAKVAGLFPQKVKDAHNPKTYLVLALLAGLKWKWCFRNPVYWFAVGFCIKWYRARYVFKIPVWDRQPNWNNIITSKEQEKDLRAFTCLNCGSTIFIAKTREFFFEGDTGIGGLGCFACGAKGKENFVMDRDRIVEDVADIDDYFDYERPLDFVSRAERRALLKQTGGDEEAANLLLLEKTVGIRETSTKSSLTSSEPNGSKAVVAADSDDDKEEEEDSIVNTEITDTQPTAVKEAPKVEAQELDKLEGATETSLMKDSKEEEKVVVEEPVKEAVSLKKTDAEPAPVPEKKQVVAAAEESKKPKKPKKKADAPPKATPKQTVKSSDDLDVMDALGMDDF
jgi:hypothetical protein